METKIIVTREEKEDASQIAAEAARAAGTTLAGNLRWYGTPPAREAPTADGRIVCVEEIVRDRCARCSRLTPTENMVVHTTAEVVMLLCPECAKTCDDHPSPAWPGTVNPGRNAEVPRGRL